MRTVHTEHGAGAVPSWEAMQLARQAHLARGELVPLLTPDGEWTAEPGASASSARCWTTPSG